MSAPYRIIIFGLSITSSWGNGHATTYRGLVRELEARGHDILFLERDVSWYAEHRDLPRPPYGRFALYEDIVDARERFADDIRAADLVLVGSYVPDGIALGQVVQELARRTAFYDIDTPVTMAKLRAGSCDYLTPQLISRYDLYLSFAGGPLLSRIERDYGAPMVRPLYCSVDPAHYYPESLPKSYDLGYLGTYSVDRQPPLDHLMLESARRWSEGRFVVAGPQYPAEIDWPENVERVDHLPPDQHRSFYNQQRFTMNITRQDMIQAGYSPSVRIFEAAACGTPIISDEWEGLDTFLIPGEEILVSHSPEATLGYLQTLDEEQRVSIGQKARAKVLDRHTAAHRAAELETYISEVVERQGLPVSTGS